MNSLHQSDVLGSEDLNDLLDLFPIVEKRHSKLWMVSSALFQSFLNNAVAGRSEATLERLTSGQKRFVETRDFTEALIHLNDKQVVILSGEPGVGKTTVGEGLCLRFVAEGYELVEVVKDLTEAEGVYRVGEKQVFFFDDFLGSNFFEALEGREDSLAIKFIERIKRDKSKRFILTTRTNILNLGDKYGSKIDTHNVRKNEYLMEVRGLVPIDRARILYNHMWHSGLEDSHIDTFYLDERYLEVIRHDGFNPRIIEFICDPERAGFPDAARYWDFILSSLENPKQIWSDSFKNQSDERIRALVKLVVFSGGEIGEDELCMAYSSLTQRDGFVVNTTSDIGFTPTLRLATKSFLNRGVDTSGDAIIDLFNPSITDFIIDDYISEIEDLICYYCDLPTVKSLKALVVFREDGVLSISDSKLIVTQICENLEFENRTGDYKLVAMDMLGPGNLKKTLEADFIRCQKKLPTKLRYPALFLQIILDWGQFSEADEAWVDISLGSLLEEDALKLLAELLAQSPSQNFILLREKYQDEMSGLLDGILSDEAADLDFGSYVNENFDPYDGCLNLDDIEGDLGGALKKHLTSFPEEVKDLNSRILNKVLEEFDFDDLDDQYRQSLEASDYEHDRGSANSSQSSDQEIHDLFSRG